MPELPNLNPAQDRAASHTVGPMLLLAGPGTGKTATLASRVARLVLSGVAPKEILAITFTQAAAQELRERISRFTGLAERAVDVSTFHALAGLIARNYPNSVARLRGRTLANESMTSKIATEVARREADIDEQDAPMRIAAFKDLLITPEQALQASKLLPPARRAIEQAWARAYAAYQAQMDSQGLYDFGDMIFGVVEGMRADTTLRARLQGRWVYLLVDEYQDINTAQDAMIHLLLGPDQNLWAVGDDDQALYGWRQADVRLLLEFAQRYKNATVMRLSENYRCPPVVLSAANRLIRSNRKRYPKELKSSRQENSPITLHRAPNADMEARWITEQIQRLIQSGTPAGGIAILARAASALGPTERALRKAGIPCQLRGAPPFWQTPVARTGLSLLSRLVSQWPMTDVRPPPEWMARRLEESQRTKQFQPVSQMVGRFLEENPPKQAGGERRAAWIFGAQQFLQECQEAGTAEGLCVRMQQGSVAADTGVHLSTIHSSKGLEWPVVFVCAWEDGVMPNKQAGDPEEERRIAYVAITRPRQRLFLSLAAERQRKESAPSPYLQEMLGALPLGMVVDGAGVPVRMRPNS